MIDVIIPAYNAHATMKRTLLSIASQNISDEINVYIVDDCSKENYNKEVEAFRGLLNITELTMPENSGPAAARQYGVDNSDGDYLIFLDSDDYFKDENSVSLLKKNIEGYDMASGAILTIFADESTVSGVDHFSLHGKMYKRSVINNFNIKFDPFRSREANVHEDNSYDNLYEFCCEKINFFEDVVYVYQFNENSITNTENDIKSFEFYIRAMTWLANQVNERTVKNEQLVSECFYDVMLYCYFKYIHARELFEYTIDMMSPLKRMYEKYIKNIIDSERVRMYKCYKCNVIPSITFYDFLDKIK